MKQILAFFLSFALISAAFADGIQNPGGGSGGGSVTTPGGGLVSSVTAACSQAASQTTLSAAECINSQVGTSYAIADSDRGKLIVAVNAAAQAYTIAQAGTASAFQSGWFTDIHNNSGAIAGVVTLTPTTSLIDGLPSIKIYPGESVRIVSDGVGYSTTFFDTQPWLTFTPAFTCGTATFATSSSRVKVLGYKATLIEFDLTITALGTCTNAITFTTPNTAASAGFIGGREVTINGKGLICSLPGSGNTATCGHSDGTVFALSEHFMASGVYENQ